MSIKIKFVVCALLAGLAATHSLSAHVGTATDEHCISQTDVDHSGRHLADLKKKLEEVRRSFTERSRYRKLVEHEYQILENEVLELRKTLENGGKCPQDG